MELIQILGTDSTVLYALVAVIFSGIAIVILRYLALKKGIPTQDLQDKMQVIHDEAKEVITEEITKTVKRDATTGRFVAKKPVAEPKEDTKPAPKRSRNRAKSAKDKQESETKEEAEQAKSSKAGKVVIGLLFLFAFTSCSLLDAGVKYASENISITWKGEEAIDTVPIDSIVIKFDAVYWKESHNNYYFADTNEVEVEFIKDGYRVWQLTTPNWKRNEVQRNDTVIYLYRK